MTQNEICTIVACDLVELGIQDKKAIELLCGVTHLQFAVASIRLSVSHAQRRLGGVDAKEALSVLTNLASNFLEDPKFLGVHNETLAQQTANIFAYLLESEICLTQNL